MEKIEKLKYVNQLILVISQNLFLIDPFLPKEYNLFS